jgi:site-specific DNA-adenine methylase
MTLDEFYDIAYESLTVYDSIDIDGVTYNLNINGLNEGIRVTVLNDINESIIDFDIFTSPDEEDIIKAIKDHLKEVAESEVK